MNQMHGNTQHTHTLKHPLVPQFTMYVMLHKLCFVVLLHLWIFQQKDWCWSWNANTLATWCKELTHWKRPWSWERLKAGREGDHRGWDVGWHHRLNGHEFEQAPLVGVGQGRLVCCSPWGHKESDTTERLNWTVEKFKFSDLKMLRS